MQKRIVGGYPGTADRYRCFFLARAPANRHRGVLRREGSGWRLRGPSPTADAQRPVEREALPSH